MKNINVLIVDDDEHSLLLSLRAMEQLVDPAHIHCARTAGDTMRILEQETIELAFLDIDMPDTSGFSIAEYIRQNKPQVKYVFLTGYVDFAARSFDYEPLDFLTKPIDLMRLRKTLERYEARGQQTRDYAKDRIAVDTSEGFVLLSPEEIAYIGKELRNIKLHCRSGQAYNVRHSLDELEAVFSDFGFFRIHQSFLAPLSNIASVRTSAFGKTYEAVLSDGTALPVSRNKYQQLRSFLVSRGIQFI